MISPCLPARPIVRQPPISYTLVPLHLLRRHRSAAPLRLHPAPLRHLDLRRMPPKTSRTARIFSSRSNSGRKTQKSTADRSEKVTLGCAPRRPLDYSGSAGLLWASNG